MRISWSPGARFASTYFALFAVFGVVAPYFQKLLYSQGFNEKEIGFIFATGSAVGIFSPPLWGWLSDHSPRRRRLIAAASLACTATFVCFGWVHTFAAALVLAGAHFFFFSPMIPLTDGLVLRYIDEHEGDYGRPRTAGSISFILIILLLERLGVSGDGGRPIILGAMVVCSLGFMVSVAFLPLTHREKAERRDPASYRRDIRWARLLTKPFLVFMAAVFLARLGMTGYYSFFTLFAQNELGYDKAGYLWAIAAFSEITVMFFSTAIIRRIGIRNMFALGVAAVVVRLFGYAVAPNIATVFALQTLHALTFAAFHTSSLHYIQRIVPGDMKQSAMTVFHSVSFSVSAIVGNAVGGMLIFHHGYRFMFACFGAITLLGFGLVLALVREPPEAKNQP